MGNNDITKKNDLAKKINYRYTLEFVILPDDL